MFWKIWKKLMKKLARSMPGNKIRCLCLKLAGYQVGEDVYVGEDLIIIDELADKGGINFGDRVAIAERVTLVLCSYPNESKILPFINKVHGTINIGADSWLGTGAIVLPNVNLGQGAVIGAGSVVTKSVPELTCVVGIPAKPIKKINAVL